ncbi:MAG: long-subunit acyl-CoA synthetase (AMP-forming) [Myxococcota bacterium]|jgi:long-subunit acyl-CoA synthetase (AMP-forming)
MTNSVVIGIALGGIGIGGAVVVVNAVIVSVIADIADIAHAVIVGVLLVWIAIDRAVVAPV